MHECCYERAAKTIPRSFNCTKGDAEAEEETQLKVSHRTRQVVPRTALVAYDCHERHS